MSDIVVPWLPGCPYRERAWRWVRHRYAAISGVTVRLAQGPSPWSKGAVVMPAIERCGEVVVVADADVWCEGLPAALAAVNAGAPWAIPHGDVHRLTQAGTAAVYAGRAWEDQALEQPAYHGIPGGGIVVAHRTLLLNVPLDPRFVGWGQEDESWGMALTSTAGEPWRGTSPLVHLWHPPQERLDRRRGSAEGWQLRRRYVKARHNPPLMAALLQEARDALHPHQSPLHDLVPDVVR